MRKILTNIILPFIFLNLPVLLLAQSGNFSSVSDPYLSAVSSELATSTPRSTEGLNASAISTSTKATNTSQEISTSTITSAQTEPIEKLEETNNQAPNNNILKLSVLTGGIILTLYAFYELNSKNKENPKEEEKKEDRSRCFDIKKLMDKKLNEITDLKSKLEDRVKNKTKEEIRDMVKETEFAEVLSIVEKGEKEYARLSELFDQCMAEFDDEILPVILVDAVYTFVSDEGVIFKEMMDLLEKYPNRKILLTGADSDKWEQYGLGKMPYEVFTLRHNPEKTDIDYYKKMLEHFELDKNDVIYFEHSGDAVKSAMSVGIKTYYYDMDKKDLVGLKKFIDENV